MKRCLSIYHSLKKQKEIHTSFRGLEIKMDKKEFLQAQVGISRTIYFSKNRKKGKCNKTNQEHQFLPEERLKAYFNEDFFYNSFQLREYPKIQQTKIAVTKIQLYLLITKNIIQVGSKFITAASKYLAKTLNLLLSYFV